MCALPCRRSGDPLALAAPGRDAAVERGGELQGDQRPAVAESAEEAGIDFDSFRPAEAGIDIETRRAQSSHALAGNARVGVLRSNHNPTYPCGDQRIGAGRGATPMATRLETDIGGGAASSVTRPVERLGLAMRPSARLRPPAPHDAAFVDDDAADRRVWPDRAEPAP